MTDVGWLKDHIRDIPDFPRAGVSFKDLTPLLAHGEAFRATVDSLVASLSEQQVDVVLGVEARGFILAAPVADRLGAGFVPVRKPGKLPWRVERQHYDLEYGTDALEIHGDAVAPGEAVVVVDDVLATGGTAAAACALVERLGAVPVALRFVLEIGFLGGRARLEGRDVVSLLSSE